MVSAVSGTTIAVEPLETATPLTPPAGTAGPAKAMLAPTSTTAGSAAQIFRQGTSIMCIRLMFDMAPLSAAGGAPPDFSGSTISRR
jgi:hypothetical protein